MTEPSAVFGDWPGLTALLRTALAIIVAFVLGTVIGFERQWRQRSAGLRTTVLVANLRDLPEVELSRANYPICEVEILNSAEDLVELEATLVPTGAEPDELDAVLTALERSPQVRSATWTVGTTA